MGSAVAKGKFILLYGSKLPTRKLNCSRDYAGHLLLVLTLRQISVNMEITDE